MTPPLACFPVCMTFLALGVLIVLVLATNALSRGDPTEDESVPEVVDSTPKPGTGPPPWWVIVLLFVWPPVVLVILAMIWPE